MTNSVKPTDEWSLLPILEAHNAVGALPEIEAKLDAFCETYLRGRRQQQTMANTRLACLLSEALIASEDSDCDCGLTNRITEITANLSEPSDAP